MVQLSFSITPLGAERIHRILVCLARFSETVSIEAREESLTFSTLNASKSAHASFALEKQFFSSFHFVPETISLDGRFTCAISNKALLTVFRARLNDPRANSGLQRCEARLLERRNATECRFVFTMYCAYGVVKTTSLMYESAEVMHALFDKQTSTNKWSTRSSYLKESIGYFSPKTEKLSISYDQGKVTLLSFTDKVLGSKSEVLRQPLKTSVMLNVSDFHNFRVQEKLHIVISVRDFKAMATHADSMNTSIHAFYSSPGKPLQFTYNLDFIYCQYTLMTAGEYRGERGANTPAKTLNPRPSTAEDSRRAVSESQQRDSMSMPPPPRPTGRKNLTTLGRRLPEPERTTTPSDSRNQHRKKSYDSDSLFVSDDDDGSWNPPNYENIAEETVQWDASDNNADRLKPRVQDTRRSIPQQEHTEDGTEMLPPTQRLSQIPRLW